MNWECRWPPGLPWSLAAVLVGLFLALAAGHLAAAGPPYAGRSLTDALLGLQAQGLKIVFTSSIVRPEMRVETEPVASDPRQILDELLAPHGLEARAGAGGTLVVVAVSDELLEDRASIQGFVRLRLGSAPVAGATIRILGPQIEVSSAADGSFEILDPPVGTFTLEASKRGFASGRREGVVVAPGQSTELTFLLDPLPVLEEQLVVTPSRVSLLREDPVALFAVDREELLALPHLGNDFFRALTLLPGTASNDVTAQFHVRGGRRDETQILLDGQELYESYHLKDFDSALSIIVPEAIGSVDLTTGGFSVEYGDRMSGVLDMTTTTPTGPPRVRLGAGVLSAHAGGAGTFHDHRGGWIAEVRRGSTDFARRLFGEEAPSYWDAFGKLDYLFNSRNSMRLNLLHTDDEFELEEVREDESKQIATDYASSYLWLTHQALFGSKLALETAVAVSRIDRDRNGLELEEDAQFLVRDERELDVLELRQSWNHQVGTRHFLRWGFELRRFDTLYDYLADPNFQNPLAEIRDLPGGDTTIFRQAFDEDHHSAHLADRLGIGERLTVEIGLRYDHHSQTSESLLSPRFNLAYAPGGSSVLRVAWGRFNQSQRPYELQVEDGETRFHPVERSEHRVIGYERLFENLKRAPGLALRIEVYQREVSNPRPRYENLYEPLNNFPEVEPDRVRIAPERSVAEGFEIFLRSRLGRRFGWWVNYAYASTEDRISGAWVARKFDQTHAFNLDLDYRLGEHWSLNLAWRYHTGWPTTPISLEPQENEDGQIGFVPVLGPLNSERLSSYHRLDLRASRKWSLGWGVLTAFADLQNVYNRRNLGGFDIEIDAEKGTLNLVEEGWAGFLPSLGFSIEF